METVFDQLKNLQEVLSQKYEIEREINEIPKTLVTKAELIARLKRAFTEKNSKLLEADERLKKIRGRLEEAQMKREGFEKQMDLIKTQREYEALDKEIKDSTEKEQQLRKELLKEEKDLEELRVSLSRDEELIAQQEEELTQEQEKIKAESAGKRELLEKLTEQEKEIIPGLDEDIIFKFERIIKSKSGIGIVPVKGSVCTGCHMVLPSQFENEVRAGDKILFCPYCSRILYYEEADTPPLFFNNEDAGGLSDLVDFEDEYDEEE
ncbi:MAG TPA: C4-type zinc ribbon domain-containing protein [Spirochaetia bacterium]|nr:C4-type zinc ribbon domain-containing protein [Spirochaetia bacterium]